MQFRENDRSAKEVAWHIFLHCCGVENFIAVA